MLFTAIFVIQIGCLIEDTRNDNIGKVINGVILLNACIVYEKLPAEAWKDAEEKCKNNNGVSSVYVSQVMRQEYKLKVLCKNQAKFEYTFYVK